MSSANPALPLNDFLVARQFTAREREREREGVRDRERQRARLLCVRTCQLFVPPAARDAASKASFALQ